MTKIKKFALISIPRTGSNMLVGALDTHPEIVCHYELFHVDEIYYSSVYGDDWIKDFNKQIRDQYPKAFLDYIYQNSFKPETKAIGFKIFQDQNNEFLKEIVYDDSIEKVILQRNNYLLARVSQLEAERSGIYDITEDAAKKGLKPTSKKVYLDIERFFYYENRKRRYFEDVERVAKERNQRLLKLDYETLLLRENMLRLLDFLEVDPNPDLLHIAFKKQNFRKLSERIANYPEVVEAFAGTRFEKYLND